MRPLTVLDVNVGLRVLYAGERDAGDVLDEAKRSAGHVLVEHHPGVIREILSRHHVIVEFMGLADEPISFGIGFGYAEETGIYPGLLIPDARHEWDEAVAAGWWG